MISLLPIPDVFSKFYSKKVLTTFGMNEKCLFLHGLIIANTFIEKKNKNSISLCTRGHTYKKIYC